MDISYRDRGVYCFGPFRLDPARRTLLRHGAPEPLTARLFDTLLYLVQNPERLVTRDELEHAVWQGRAVEEGNLAKAVSALRRALQTEEPSAPIIVTVTGRGFQFTMPVTFEPSRVEAAATGGFGASDTHDSQSLPVPRRRRAAIGVCSLVLLLAGYSVWYIGSPGSGRSAFAPPAHSVAVMAFTNLSGDAGQEYFSDGLSEELIDALGRVGAVRVAARLSSFSFKGKPIPIGDIARTLNVGTVLEGSVRRDGAHLRVTAQLVDGATGFQLWSNHYDSEPADILKVQGQIAEAVTASLQVTLLGADMTKLTLGGTANPAAFDAYLHGISLANQKMANSSEQAVKAFETAVELDPGFVLAMVQHAKALIAVAESYDGSDVGFVQETRADALFEARRAVALAPNLGAAHAVLGTALDEAWDFAAADDEYTRAEELAPGDAWINWLYAGMLMFTGHKAAGLELAKRSVQLDPLSMVAYRRLATALTVAGLLDDARAALRDAEALGYSGPGDIGQRARIQLRGGEFGEARRSCSGAANSYQIYCLALADHALGRQADAEADLAKLRASDGDDAAYQYAEIYAQWGRTQDTLHWLETAYRLHDDGLIDLPWDYLVDPIRNEPRFKAVERAMHFPP